MKSEIVAFNPRILNDFRLSKYQIRCIYPKVDEPSALDSISISTSIKSVVL